MNNGFFTGKVIKQPKFARGKNGMEYVVLFVRDMISETYRGHQPLGQFTCFTPKVVKYLKNVGVKAGDFVVVVYQIDNFMEEVKGKVLQRTGTLATKIWVVKTLKDVKQTNN